MPKAKDKGGSKCKVPANRANRQVQVCKAKAGGKSRKKVEVHRDAVLKEKNEDFEKPPARARGAKWTRPEVINLFIAANARRNFIKGAFGSHSGGTESRVRAWQEVSDFVNEVSVQHRSVQQCQSKVNDFVGDAKTKLRQLKKSMAQTGSGSIPDDLHLLREDIMALDYAGDEAVTGIPGTRASTLFKNRPKKNEYVPWTSYRKNKTDYYKAFKANKQEKEGSQPTASGSTNDIDN